MTTATPSLLPIAPQGPLDAHGRLVHEDDDAAQLALALARVEEQLSLARLRPDDLVELRVRTTDMARLMDVYDVLTDRLGATTAAPVVSVTEVPALPVPGMTVALDAVAADRARRLLVVVAHPDDEAFGCGSLLAHASAHGVASTVVCATRGELGEPSPASGLSRHELPAAREAELREACRLLGVERVELLDYVDSGVDGEPAPGSLAAADPHELSRRVARLVDDVRPDVVVTLDASDGHRDHAAMRDATLAALDLAAHRPGSTYLFCLARSLMTEFTGVDSLGTPDAELTTVVDVADLLDLRWRAIRAHSSQVPPFDAMDEDLQHGFLAVDRLQRVDPPWPGGPTETSWLAPSRTRTQHQTHHQNASPEKKELS
jgi:LmbE family N-acetylglucosaminyl deacetylase/enamine deaminase RidA (YjgF/YER057c/UK114 family)